MAATNAKTMAIRARSFDASPSRAREVAFIAAIVLGLFALTALAGWTPVDHVWTTGALARPGNPCGPLGAWLADALYAGFGYGAWATFLVIVGGILGLAGRHLGTWGQRVAGLVAWVDLLVLLALAFEDGPGGLHAAGGDVGAALAAALSELVGVVGAWLLALGVLGGAATWHSGIRWSQVASWLVEGTERAIPVVRTTGSQAQQRIGQAAVAGGAGLVEMGAELGKGAGRGAVWSGRQLASAARGALGWSGLAASRAVAMVGRMVGAVTRGPPEDEPWEDALEEDDATDDVARPVAAEVAWDPTSAGGAADAVADLFPAFGRRKETRAPRPSGPPPLPMPVAPPPSGAPLRPSASRRAPLTVEDLPSDAGEEDEMDSAPPGRAEGPASEPDASTPDGEVHVHKSQYLDLVVQDDGGAIARAPIREYQLPTLSLLDSVPHQDAVFEPDELMALARTVEASLESFRVTGRVTDVRVGPVVTTFAYLPDSGISVKRITGLADDLAMNLRALSVRVVAPIPGKGVVGIEIPSAQRLMIFLRQILATPEFRDNRMALPCVLGKSVEGKPMIADLAKMPHLLVGGTTGSGKSVGVNGMLMSLLFTRSPSELRLLLIDPKKLEFEAYSDIPHLLHPVVTQPNHAAAALAWCCREMEDRYELLARWGTRNIRGYNEKVEKERQSWTPEKAWKYAPRDWDEPHPPAPPEKLPYIVIVIDELADLMMVAKKDVQDSIVRLAQMARACGMHLVIATQRPSVDVITGLIKSNLPTRIAFKLRSVVDSRTILDHGGAEKLLGGGDMLYLPGAGEVERCHGAFVSDEEVVRVADFLRAQGKPDYIAAVTADAEVPAEIDEAELDPLYDQALEVVLAAGKASTSMVQRHLKIGYNRAARIIDLMEHAGVVGPADGARPREVLSGR